MRIALLGADEQTLRIAAAAIAEGHSLAAASESEPFAAEIKRLVPLIDADLPWENLLAGSPADVTLVGGSLPFRPKDDPRSAEDIRGEQLRRLAQEEMPLVLQPPGCDLDTAYELEAIRRDRNGFVATWIDDWRRPAWDRIEALLAADHAGPLGMVEKLTWERYLPERSRAAVRRQFVADLAILRRLFGPIRTIYAAGAHGQTHYDPFAPKRGLPDLSQVTIQIGVDRPCVVRWSASAKSEAETGQITVIGSKGRWIVRQTEESNDWEEESHVPGSLSFKRKRGVWHNKDLASDSTQIDGQDDPDSVGLLWTTIEQSLVGNSSPVGALPAWFDSCRDLESLEAIDRSLARGRTVALHAEETDEEEAFKGIMASGGCLLLMFIPFVLLAVAVLPIPGLRRYAAPAMIAVIVVFLALQGLRFLVRPKPTAGD